MKYLSKYIKERYVTRKIRRDIYERFIAWCGEQSINRCLEKALNILATNITPNMVANITSNTDSKYSEPEYGDPDPEYDEEFEGALREVFEQLEKELEEMERKNREGKKMQ